MKRPLETSSDLEQDNTIYKTDYLPPLLPTELWCKIASENHWPSLAITSRFFAYSPEIKAVYLKKRIQENYLDYAGEDEFLDYITYLVPKSVQALGKLASYKGLIAYFDELLKENKKKWPPGSSLDVFEEQGSFEAITPLRDSLFSACYYGHLAILKELIASESWNIQEYINTKFGDEEGVTVLGHAAMQGRKRIFSLLLEHDAQLIVDDDPLIDVSLAYCVPMQMTPLHAIALRSDHLWLLNILEQFPHKLEPLFTEDYKNCVQLISSNQEEALERILNTKKELIFQEDGASWTLLEWASSLGKTNCMKILINMGANVTRNDNCPLLLACATGNLEAIKYLVEHGAAYGEFDAYTGLHITAYHGYSDCVCYFVEECKLDVNEKTLYGDTALFLARIEVTSENVSLPSQKIAQKLKCAQLLIDFGAIDAQTPNP